MESADELFGSSVTEPPEPLLRAELTLSALLKGGALEELFYDLPDRLAKDVEEADLVHKLSNVFWHHTRTLGTIWPESMLLKKSSTTFDKLRFWTYKIKATDASYVERRAEGSACDRSYEIRGRQIIRDWNGLRAELADTGALHSRELCDSAFMEHFNRHYTVLPYVEMKPVWIDSVWWHNAEQRYAEDYQDQVRELDKTAAGKKAEELLWDHLSPEQRRSWIKSRSFTVVMTGEPPSRWKSRGQKKQIVKRDLFYKYHEGRQWKALEGRRYLFDGTTCCGTVNGFTYDWQHRFNACCHPPDPFPTGDALLSMKLLLERDEQEFLKTSNLTTFGTGRAVVDLNVRARGLHLCKG